jgi:glycosyltransferase involved in cell wall biosynthesis
MTSNAEPTDPRQLRVAIFSDSFPERNGAGAYYSDLSAQLEERLGGIMVFQPVVKKRLFMKLAFPLPGDKTQKLLTPNVFRISKECKAFNPHLIIAVTPGPFGMLGLYLSRRGKTGFLTAFHTHFEGLVQMYGDTLFFRFANWYLELINKILCKRSQSVLINNEGLSPTVKRLGAPKSDVMGTPLALNFVQSPVVPPSGGLRRIIFAGRLAPEKNLPVVVEAIRALPDIEFVMAGEGPLRAEMEAVAAECPNLRMTGWLSREELCAEVDQADLLILPSHTETFGTVALEAMARGRPALVAEDAGIHEWTVLSEALFVLKSGQSMTEVIEELRQLPESTWQEKATAAREAALKLNNETIDQWVGFVQEYARTRDAAD